MNIPIFIGFFCLFIVKSSGDFNAWITCLECNSIFNDTQVAACEAEGYAFPGEDHVKEVSCVYGACYSTLETVNDVVVGSRGCTNDLPDMPYTLPQEGCYTWRGKTICVCFEEVCNLLPPEASSGKSLDDHLKNPVDIESRGHIQCYQCMNYDEDGEYYKQCPKDKLVDNKRAYFGECNTTCFTRTFGDNPKRVARGCSDTQWGLPEPLPPDGCYNWNNGVWCVCNSVGCNGRPMAKSSGKELDDHLYTDVQEDFEEADGLNRCYECINYDSKGTYYKQCPKDKRVRNAFYSVCNGTCFTRSYDYDDKKVARGCTETQWGLPDPLPPDGCYKWYSEVWCVCSKTRCNRNPLGKAQDIEFDAHIPKKGRDNASMRTAPSSYVITILMVFCCVFWIDSSQSS